MEIRINTLTPELFLDLYRSVGWEPPRIEQVNAALQNTPATFTCYEGDCPVGMARVIGDGGMSFCIPFLRLSGAAGRGYGKCRDFLEVLIRDIREEQGKETDNAAR